MSESVPETEIQVIRTAILNFLESMKKEKRTVEQQIRERTENIRSSTLNTGATQFSYQEVDDLAQQYKEEYLNYYRNTIHMKIVSKASSEIKTAIEEGFMDADIVQQEWLEGFKQLQGQINEYQAIADKAEQLEDQLEGSKIDQSNIQELKEKLEEKDQLLAEKDQEIMNLNEGLKRMEDQMNSMGQSMLENSMTIEELQEAINDRDNEIERLKTQINESQGSSEEVEVLKQQLEEAQERERELQQQVSSASSDLVSQLQDNLEETREQVLNLRRELVQKNEELHSLRLDHDELKVKIKQKDEQLKEIKLRNAQLTDQNETLNDEIESLQTKNEELERSIGTKETEITELSRKVREADSEIAELREKLEGYEGKVAMSAEEKEQINRQLEDMKGQLNKYQETIDYLKNILGDDLKFRVILFLSSMNEQVRLDDLATAVNATENSVQRAIIELAHSDKVITSHEGRFLFCQLQERLEPPLILTK